MSAIVAIPLIGADVLQFAKAQAPGAGSAMGSFAGELADAVERIEKGSTENANLVTQFLRGEDVELHTVALRAQEAQATFELFLQVRNKLLQGYQEIMRMQI